MRAFDLTPLFRSTVGFDRLGQLMDAAHRAADETHGYPPYNIERVDDDAYRVVMAVAGFSEDDLTITAKENELIIAGRVDREDESDVKVLHRGIAARAFERRFQLADHIKVRDAELANGLLSVELYREVPEELKPRTIGIVSGSATRKIEDKKAA